jgi:hypothetical protein
MSAMTTHLQISMNIGNRLFFSFQASTFEGFMHTKAMRVTVICVVKITKCSLIDCTKSNHALCILKQRVYSRDRERLEEVQFHNA